MKPLYIKIKDNDNVALAIKEIKEGTEIMDGIVTKTTIPQGHKIALTDIKKALKLLDMVLYLAMQKTLFLRALG